MVDRIHCDRCGWELRDSDIHCSLCGLPQRLAAAEPETLSLTVPHPGEDEAFELISPGSVLLRNAGRHSFRILGIAASQGLHVTTEPKVDPETGLTLAANASLRVQGTRNGELPPEEPRILVSTSIGTLRLPVHSLPLPPLHLSPRRFRVPSGKPWEVRCELSLAAGVEWLRLESQGAGVALLEPTERLRLEAGTPRPVVLRADVALSNRDAEGCGLVVQLDDGLRLRSSIVFEAAAPGRLLPANGATFLDLRVFPGERVTHDLELINDGVLDYVIRKLEVRTDAGEPFPGLGGSSRFVDPQGEEISLPHTVAAGTSITLRLASEPMPAAEQVAGAIVAHGEGLEDFRFPLRIDLREAPRHLFPVGLDFGTSVSAVASRTMSQRHAGRVQSIAFEPGARSFLPSDVEVIDAPGQPDPAFLIAWGGEGARHLAYARNLKRRVGASEDGKETVAFRGRVREIQVEDMAAFVVGEMKRQTERWLGGRIGQAVATVPTRFSLRRVNAIRDIYSRAGLAQVHLVDEAVAAGILGMYNQFKDRDAYTMLVYDMGGGTTDVTLFRVENRVVDGVLEIRPTVRGVAGDARLGGTDVTAWMVRRVLENLPAAEREAIPWPDQGLAAPELQQIARRNQNELFQLLDGAKLRLYKQDPPVPQMVSPALLDRSGKRVALTQLEFTGAEVKSAFQPRLEELWRELLDMVVVAGPDPVDILYFAGRSSQLPFVKNDLPEWLAKRGPFPKLQAVVPQDREGNVVLKEAVSLGACLSQDLLYGIDERLVLENLDDRSASRFGLRNQRGEFLEILPANWRLGQLSDNRVPVRLGTPLRSDRYEAHLEVWENPTRNPRIDGNAEAEFVGHAEVLYRASEVDPSRLTIEVGLVLGRDRRMSVVAWHDGRKKEVRIGR